MDKEKLIDEILLHCKDILKTAGIIDRNGHVIPRESVVVSIEKDFPDKPVHERWTMAQKQTLLDWWAEKENKSV